MRRIILKQNNKAYSTLDFITKNKAENAVLMYKVIMLSFIKMNI